MALKADVPHWDLDQYYLPGSGKLETDLALLRTKCEDFAGRRRLLVQGQALGPAEFLDCLRELEDITRLAHFLEGYAALAFAQDTSD
ncbi:MAG: hypothetical protein LBL95_07795, partial [Deltaproteobacteria bacterium]|nr:hypothetical protein [Deltaproteobacteria bacterium]